jgi:hypothetical protein
MRKYLLIDKFPSGCKELDDVITSRIENDDLFVLSILHADIGSKHEKSILVNFGHKIHCFEHNVKSALDVKKLIRSDTKALKSVDKLLKHFSNTKYITAVKETLILCDNLWIEKLKKIIKDSNIEKIDYMGDFAKLAECSFNLTGDNYVKFNKFNTKYKVTHNKKQITNKIVHVINISDFDKDSRLWKEQISTIQSIVDNGHPDVINIAVGTKDIPHSIIPTNWKIEILEETARDFIPNESRDLPRLIDVLDIASKYADNDDWLLFTNTDCSISNRLYFDTINKDRDYVEFIRQDIQDDESEILKWGIDGVAYVNSKYKEIRHYLGNCVIGAPLWDNIVWILGRYHTLTMALDVENLLHIKHELTWDIYNLDKAGLHNLIDYKNILRDLNMLTDKELDGDDNLRDITYKILTQYKISPVGFKRDELPPLYVIMGTHGSDDTRTKNLKTVIKNLKIQRQPYTLILVESTVDDISLYRDVLTDANIHITTPYNELQHNLFLKESLWNLGTRYVPDDGVIIYLDGDIWSKDRDWFTKMQIRVKYGSQPTVVHGFRTTKDTGNNSMDFIGLVYKNQFGNPSDKTVSPGICYCLTKNYFDEINGFNVFNLLGMGDTMFFEEIAMKTGEFYEPCMEKWFTYGKKEIFKQIRRDVKKCYLDSVNVDTIHETHGPIDNRKYEKRFNFNYSFDRDVHDFITLNDDGIIQWKTTDCIEYETLENFTYE